MMKFYCRCINVCIKVSEISQFNGGDELSESEKMHEYFKPFLKVDVCVQSVFNVFQLPLIETHMCEIFTQHSLLIESEVVGSWVIFKCINCATSLYAIQRDENSSIRLINDLLCQISDEELQNIKRSSNYSPVFKVVISNFSSYSDETETSQIPDDYYCDRVCELKNVLLEAIERKKKATEETIQNFKEEQQNMLKKFILRANNDFQILQKVLSSEENSAIKSNENQIFEPKRYSNILVLSDGEKIFEETSPDSVALGNEENCEKDLSFMDAKPSLDSEILFPLDGMDGNAILEDDDHSEEDLSDTDDSGSRDEGIHIPRRKSLAIARSLPIRVPSDFDHSFRLFENRFEDKAKPNYKQKRNDGPLDIAASIQALANSVHGDAVFGDLPRPKAGSRI